MKPIRRRDLVSAVRAAIDGGAARQAPSVKPTVAAPVGATHPLRILLVEDTEDNRLLIQAYLKNSPHTLVMAEDGKLAVEAFHKAGPSGFDVVLMDMQMPVMDGYDATREIRRMESADGMPRTPIVALTAFALPQEAKSAIDAGCDEYLTKPIKKATLLEALARYGGDAA
jgi:CheY-like chemotaxis protein